MARRLRPPKKPKGDDGFGSGLSSSNSSDEKAAVPTVSGGAGYGMSMGGWGNGMAMGYGAGGGMGMDNAVALGADPQMGAGISDTVFHGFRRQQRSGGGGGGKDEARIQLLPNLQLVLMDQTHASRRMLG